MTDKEAYRFTERCLYRYPANVARIDVLREDMRVLRIVGDVKAQRYEGHSSVRGCHADPVSVYVEKLEHVEHKLQSVMRCTLPIRRLVEDLSTPYALDSSRNAQHKEILELYYFGANSLCDVLEQTHWSRSSFFIRKKELLVRARSYLGV